jgi:hypothetical protein
MKYMCDCCEATFPTATACTEHELVCSGKVKRVNVTHHVLNFSFDHCGVLRTDMVITGDYGYYHKDGKYYYDIAGEHKLDCVGDPTTCIGDCDDVYFCYTRVNEFDPLSYEEIEDILYSLLTEHLRDMRESIDRYLNKEESGGNNRS